MEHRSISLRPHERPAAWRRTKVLALATLSILSAGLLPPPLPAAAPPAPDRPLGTFSHERAGGVLPTGWERWLASDATRLTRYKMVEVKGRILLRAISQGSGSGLVRRLATPLALPLRLSWSWQALEQPTGSDLGRAATDDAAARVCALFGAPAAAEAAAPADFAPALPAPSGEPAATHALCYAWSDKGKVDDLVESGPRIRTLIVETGVGKRRVTEDRDLGADFERAFATAPGPLVAVGLWTDSDATDSQASAYYGDLDLRPAP